MQDLFDGDKLESLRACADIAAIALKITPPSPLCVYAGTGGEVCGTGGTGRGGAGRAR